MPGSYPAAPPTLTGDLETISRFLQNPTQLRRRLRTFQDLRFVADQILTQRFRTQGGAILYEQSEPFVSDRQVEAVDAGSEYPFANLPTGTGAIASVSKWGQKVRLTDEEIERNVYAGSAIDRSLRKVVNSIIKQVDGVAMSAFTSAVTATSAAGAVWSTGTPTILKDIMKAKAVIVGLNLGYNPDTIVMDDSHYAYLMSDTNVTNALRRETTDNPIYTGTIERLGGLTIVVSPNIGANPYVLDSQQVGGMADEVDGAPGYAVSDLAVQIKSIRHTGGRVVGFTAGAPLPSDVPEWNVKHLLANDLIAESGRLEELVAARPGEPTGPHGRSGLAVDQLVEDEETGFFSNAYVQSGATTADPAFAARAKRDAKKASVPQVDPATILDPQERLDAQQEQVDQQVEHQEAVAAQQQAQQARAAKAAEAGQPAQNEPKAAWVDYAVGQGVNRADAEAMSKEQLVGRFGSKR
jgi:hypothetical protein